MVEITHCNDDLSETDSTELSLPDGVRCSISGRLVTRRPVTAGRGRGTVRLLVTTPQGAQLRVLLDPARDPLLDLGVGEPYRFEDLRWCSRHVRVCPDCDTEHRGWLESTGSSVRAAVETLALTGPVAIADRSARVRQLPDFDGPVTVLETPPSISCPNCE